VAERLKMPLGECMEKHTERQIDAWLQFFDVERHNPSDPTLWYLMQIACEVVRSRVEPKSMSKIKIEDFKLRFSSKEEQKSDFKPTPQMYEDMMLATTLGPEGCRKLLKERKAKQAERS